MNHLFHLVRRFFGSLVARRPPPRDQALVARLLSPEEGEVFWTQPTPDLAHALRSTRAVFDTAPGRSDMARAALLHDIGKRHAGIGTLRRAVATGFSMLGVPMRGRLKRYLDHAELGASDLGDLGCEDLVVQFARHHHGSRPPQIALKDWSALVAADYE